MKVGIFDSGRGGEFVAQGLSRLLPQHQYIVVNDRENVPYGSKSDNEVIELTDSAIQPLLFEGCRLIIIACNTATMAGIAELRARHPDVLFIGAEPMIKTASLSSSTKKIAVLATPLTISSDRYHQLKATFASGVTIHEPDTAQWARHIENDQIDTLKFTDLDSLTKNGVDTIVLACTHYIILKPLLHKRYPDADILEPTAAIARQIERLAQ